MKRWLWVALFVGTMGLGLLISNLQGAGTPRGGSIEITVAASGSTEVDAAAAKYQCDGTADDVQIQQAITVIGNAGGGKVKLGRGVYTLSAALSIPAYVEVSGTGYSTVLVAKADTAVFQNSVANVTNLTIEDLRITGVSSGYSAVDIDDANDVTVRNVYFEDVDTAAIDVNTVDGLLVTGCYAPAGVALLTEVTSQNTVVSGSLGDEGAGGLVISVASADATEDAKRVAHYVCDGTADEVEIQAAIALLSDRGGTVQLLVGTYNILNHVELNSNIILQGEGKGTVIVKQAGGDIYAPLRQKGADQHITIRDLCVNGNGVDNDGVTGNGSANKGIFLNGYSTDRTASHHFLIENVEVYNCDGEGLCIDYSEYCTIRNCYVHDNPSAGITFAQVNHGAIYDNHVESTGTNQDVSAVTLEAGIHIENSSYIDCFSNHVVAPEHYGIAVACYGPFVASFPTEHINIHDNSVVGAVHGNASIYVGYNSDTTNADCSNINIRNNWILNTYTSEIAAIYLEYLSGGQVADNWIDTYGSYGIDVQSTCDDIRLSGNLIDPNDVTATIHVEDDDSLLYGKGPSAAIWEDENIEEMRNNPSLGFLYETHFAGPHDPTTSQGWIITQTTSGTITADQTQKGGVLLADTAGHAGANDGVEAQLPSCGVIPAAGQIIKAEFRVKMVNTGQDQYYIGLAAIDTSLLDAGLMDDVVDKVGFYREHATTADRLYVINSNAAVQTEGVKCIVADNTYVYLGFVITGLDSVEYYVDGESVQVYGTNFPDGIMFPSFVAKCGQTETDAELSIDWLRIVQRDL